MESNKIESKRDVVFLENSFKNAKEIKAKSTNEGENILSQDGLEELVLENEIELGKRISLEENKNEEKVKERKVKFVDEKAKLEKEEVKGKRKTNVPSKYGMVDWRDIAMACVQGEEPTTFEEAIRSEEKEEWTKAMENEMNSLEENKTWELVELPKGKKAIGSKWVYKVKVDSSGKIEKYKARLCAKGFSQKEGIDYNDTYAAVLKYKSKRIILMLAASMDYELKQLDAITAFLNGTLKEVVYMKQPEGYATNDKNGNELVCKLSKTLYGLKQAPHEWNEEVNGFIVNVLKFKRCISDQCVYVKKSKTNKIIIIGLFVDDFIYAYHKQDEEEVNCYKETLMNKYKIKDIGNVEWLLGMKVIRDREKKPRSIYKQSIKRIWNGKLQR
jgi:hypothetical protein